jgi:hypothetical protein
MRISQNLDGAWSRCANASSGVDGQRAKPALANSSSWVSWTTAYIDTIDDRPTDGHSIAIKREVFISTG